MLWFYRAFIQLWQSSNRNLFFFSNKALFKSSFLCCRSRLSINTFLQYTISLIFELLHKVNCSPWPFFLYVRKSESYKWFSYKDYAECYDDNVTEEIPPSWLFLCSIFHSEFRGGSCRLAPLLTAAALLGAPAQLHGTLVGGCGRYQHGAADFTQLRGESAETVLLVGHRLLLHYLPSFRHLLEHLCIWAAGGADTTSSLMKAPPLPRGPIGPPPLIHWLQPWSKQRLPFDLS